MSMEKVAREWLMARDVIASVFIDLGYVREDAEKNAAAAIARLASHDPPLLICIEEDDKGENV